MSQESDQSERLLFRHWWFLQACHVCNWVQSPKLLCSKSFLEYPALVYHKGTFHFSWEDHYICQWMNSTIVSCQFVERRMWERQRRRERERRKRTCKKNNVMKNLERTWKNQLRTSEPENANLLSRTDCQDIDNLQLYPKTSVKSNCESGGTHFHALQILTCAYSKLQLQKQLTGYNKTSKNLLGYCTQQSTCMGRTISTEGNDSEWERWWALNTVTRKHKGVQNGSEQPDKNLYRIANLGVQWLMEREEIGSYATTLTNNDSETYVYEE